MSTLTTGAFSSLGLSAVKVSTQMVCLIKGTNFHKMGCASAYPSGQSGLDGYGKGNWSTSPFAPLLLTFRYTFPSAPPNWKTAPGLGVGSHHGGPDRSISKQGGKENYVGKWRSRTVEFLGYNRDMRIARDLVSNYSRGLMHVRNGETSHIAILGDDIFCQSEIG